MIRSACGCMADEHGRELTLHGTREFPVAFYDDNLEAEKVDWHWHDELEASIVVEGEVDVFAGAQRERFFPGDAFFINSRVLHTVENVHGGACCIHTIVFHPRLVGSEEDSLFWKKYVLPLLTEPATELFSIRRGKPWRDAAIGSFLAAWEAKRLESEGYELEIRYQLSRLMLLLRQHCGGDIPVPCVREQRSAERVKTMLEYVHAHFGEAMDTNMIAASASVSASECLRCFHRVIHMTPIQYLRQYRIRRASELLRQTRLPVSEIGMICGFQEMSYFARCFREIQGCSPTQYRGS